MSTIQVNNVKRVDGTQSFVIDSDGSVTFAADLNLGDNNKAVFGAGSDLQIYHNGSNSYISDQGTGGLFILASNFNIADPTDSENVFAGVADGAVYLYYDGSPKLTTSGSGIDVTGTVSADAVTVNGTGTSNFTSTATSPVQINGTSIPTLTVRNSSTPVETQVRATTTEGLVRTPTNHPLVFGTNATERMRIDSSGKVGIGTTSPAQALHVTGGGGAGALISSAGTTNGGILYLRNETTSNYTWRLGVGGGDNAYVQGRGFMIRDDNAAATRFVINESGNVGIGTNTPGSKLTVQDGSTADLLLESTLSTNSQLKLSAIAFGTPEINVASNHGLIFKTNNTEAMRIDSSGRLLVGKTSTSVVAGVDIDGGLKVYSDGTNNVSGTDYVVWIDKASGADWSIGCTFTNSDYGYIARTQGAATYAIAVERSDDNSIRFRVDGNGNAYANSHGSISDVRLKENISQIAGSIDILKNIRGVRYTWKENQEADIGVIAQEIEPYIPEVVKGEDAVEHPLPGGKTDILYKNVDYGKINAVLIEALKEAIARIEQNETTIADLTARIETLEGN